MLSLLSALGKHKLGCGWMSRVFRVHCTRMDLWLSAHGLAMEWLITPLITPLTYTKPILNLHPKRTRHNTAQSQNSNDTRKKNNIHKILSPRPPPHEQGIVYAQRLPLRATEVLHAALNIRSTLNQIRSDHLPLVFEINSAQLT